MQNWRVATQTQSVVESYLFPREQATLSRYSGNQIAAVTSILALVEIEKNSPHRFEFFMGRVCEEPISARTAYTFAKAGGEIAHGLSVYECRLRQPKQVKTIFKFLSDGSEQTRSALDLSFQVEAVADTTKTLRILSSSMSSTSRSP